MGANALIRACHYDRLHIIRYLIEDIDVDPNPSNKNDWSAVGEASMRGKLRTVKYLCEEVTVNIVMKDYVSPLQFIIYHRLIHLLILFLALSLPRNYGHSIR